FRGRHCALEGCADTLARVAGNSDVCTPHPVLGRLRKVPSQPISSTEEATLFAVDQRDVDPPLPSNRQNSLPPRGQGACQRCASPLVLPVTCASSAPTPASGQAL